MKTNFSPNYGHILNRVNLDDIYIQQVFDYYRQSYLNSEKAQLFVEQSPRVPDLLREHDFIGLCDRKLGLEIGTQRSLEGGAIRGSMKRMGLFLATGGELFRNCVVFPEFSASGCIVAASAYRYGERIRKWQQSTIQWERPDPEHYTTNGLERVKEILHAKAFH